MRIATLGDINIDVVLTVDHLPAPGEEVFSSSRTELLGGSAVNTGVVLTRLGHQVTVMGAVGDDGPGRAALSRLASIGVATDLTGKSTNEPTAMNTVLVTPDGERTMIGARGANTSYTPPTAWERGIYWLHISGYALMRGKQSESAVSSIDMARNNGIPISLDVPTGVGGLVGSTLTGLLGGFTLVAGNQASLGEITKSDRPVEHLIAFGVERVAMTSGPNPLVLADGSGDKISVTPPRVDSIDATGAGDAFVAGLVAATLGGLDTAPSAVLAAAVGAAATLAAGASATLADPEVWPDLLDPNRWSDAQPDWLDTVGRFISPLT